MNDNELDKMLETILREEIVADKIPCDNCVYAGSSKCIKCSVYNKFEEKMEE